MMSLKSKRELLEVLRPRYLKANKVEKQKMLDEFTSATGYHRKHAIRVLKNQRQVQNHLKGKTKTYKAMYRGEVVRVLGADLGGLWAYLFQTVTAISGGRHQSAGTLPGNRSFKRHERTIAKHQFCQHRSLLTPCSHPVVTWLEHHQAGQPAQKPHSSSHLHRMG